MKTVKRIFAVAVTLLLIAMMIPAVSAASNTVNWTCDKPGYTYTVYKVGSYNATTGAYTADYNALKASIEANTTDTAAVAAACKDITFSGSGAATFTTDAGSGSFTVDNGIYYIKLSAKSPNFKAITQESVVVFPNSFGANKTNATTLSVDLGGKITEGEPTTSKWFKVGTTETQAQQTYGSTDSTKTITYVLKATLPSAPVDTLIITDKMGTGLKTDVHNIVSAELFNGATKIKDVGATITTTATEINIAKADTVNGKNGTTDNTFGVKIDTADLVYPAADSTDIYTVAVTYTTELDPATAQVNTDIPNSNDLIYGNDSAYNVVPGNTVIARTYTIKAYKEDADDGSKLEGATFTLYDADKKVIATATSAARTGEADFNVLLPAGTYYVKETAAPSGYNLNSTEETITLGASTTNGIATVTIKDTKAKLPSTGGTGTMVFTVVGGSLVLLAAALFIVVMKKRSSAK